MGAFISAARSHTIALMTGPLSIVMNPSGKMAGHVAIGKYDVKNQYIGGAV
jgi:hypothetical protein